MRYGSPLHLRLRFMLSRNPTLVIHGFLAPAVTNLPIHAMLRRRGVRTFDVPIPGLNTQDIALSSQAVGRKAREVLETTGASQVNLVGVSMGGLIAVHFVRCGDHRGLVRRVVTLGSPLSGTEVVSKAGKVSALVGPAAGQMAPGSEIVRAIADSTERDTEIVSIWTLGDTVVSAVSADLLGVKLARAPVGVFPMGHYQLVVDPRNLGFMADQLLGP